MLWLAGKFSTTELVRWAFLPSFTLFLTTTWMLARNIVGESRDIEEETIRLTNSEKAVIGMALLSFPMPLLASQIHLPPYMGLLFGLGCVGLLISFFHNKERKVLEAGKTEETEELPEIKGSTESAHLSSDIEKKLARTDIASLMFFAGILLAVGALEHLGILETISHFLLGEDPSIARYVVGSGSLGVLSAIVDNIPITAAAMGILSTSDPAIWTLLAICVGTGGSMLIIGSAAGVVAMGRVKELTFFRYLRLATLPNAIGFVAALVVWTLQYVLLR
jgi:Na+/H+ antiporter NhaD/arsenite permease-like protein